MTVLATLAGAAGGAAASPLIVTIAARTARTRPITWDRYGIGTAIAAALAGALLAAAALPVAVTAAVTVAMLIAAAAALVDLVEHRLPNPLTAALVVAGVVLCSVVSLTTDWGSPLRGLFGLLVLGAWMLVLAVVDLGAGDVKLAAGVGWWLAWMSWPVFAAGVAVASLAMATTIVVNHRLRGPGRSPLGPAITSALIGGCLAAAWLA